MMKSVDNVYINVFEAAVVNYPLMHLDADVTRFKLKSHLVPNAIGDKAYLQAACVSPWRTIMISDDARDIVSSKMILNLNDPSKIDDTSWIKPMKYVGVWWEMHVGKSTWDYAGSQNDQNALVKDLKPTGKHGATKANTKRYIDFASKHGFDGVLVEGWNVGWEDWFGNWKEDVFDFVTPYPDFNIAEISAYAKSKGVKMIMHSETSGSVANFERHLDRSLQNMINYDYPAVKTGYVGRIIPRGEFHDGQTMVNHFNFVARRAADYKVMVNSHESSRPTGYNRTYPNYIAAEAARGTEFNAWSNGNPPMHETILPFTRLLGGPMDYTPGIFEIKMSHYDATKKEQVHTTLAKQLALYVTMYSPLQMAADLPENYEKYPDAFQFIKDVAADWDESKYIEAEPGDYLTVVRKTKGKESWFLGAITDENPRKTEIKLDFLTPNKKYKAIIYQDEKTEDWQKKGKIIFRTYFDELAYWHYLSLHPLSNDDFRMQYYVFIEQYLTMMGDICRTRIIKPCTPITINITKESNTIKEMDCPLDLGISLVIGSIELNCEKFSIEGGELLMFKYEKNFKTRESTLHFGIGVNLDLDVVDVDATEYVFIKFDGNGGYSDAGIKTEASAEKIGRA